MRTLAACVLARLLALSPVVGLAVVAAGCASTVPYERPAAPPLPAAFKENADWKSAAPADQAARGAWWEVFQDPQLNALEEQIDGASLTLRMAQARFVQARAAIAIVRKEFNIDDKRMYIMGHSMGGAGALFLGSKYANMFAAVGAGFCVWATLAGCRGRGSGISGITFGSSGLTFGAASSIAFGSEALAMTWASCSWLALSRSVTVSLSRAICI